MALEAALARSASPALSGRSSPNLRAGRKFEDEALQKNDKGHRRYAAGIDKALSTFESSHQDWADYIAFLGRLLKAIQAVKDTPIIPHSSTVSLRLAQCLNPTLPSGVHQKALDVYGHIFDLLQSTSLGRDLPTFLPGLLSVLSFASLTVRPLFYDIFERHILKLDRNCLRAPLKSIILALLPGIEDETSEDFERGVAVLDQLRLLANDDLRTEKPQPMLDPWTGYFWQCFFLAVITGDTRRQGALAYLSRRLPAFKPLHRPSTAESNGHVAVDNLDGIPDETRSIIHPEPGLLIRCFASGLRDTNMLVQRGFLDLLVSNVPLDSEFLQSTVPPVDLDILVGAAVTMVLRRDMSLNRRLWAWFLGPETATGADELEDTSIADIGEAPFSKQASYFQRAGAESLQRCLLEMFAQPALAASEMVRPFRISSALMDRWEIGGYLLPSVLIPALRTAFEYSTTDDKRGADEVTRSASLFFDGIESSLIWAQIIQQLSSAMDLIPTDTEAAQHILEFLTFVVTRFNIREEDMLAVHVPRTLLVALHDLSSLKSLHREIDTAIGAVFEFALSLMSVLPEYQGLDYDPHDSDFAKIHAGCTKEVKMIKQSSRDLIRANNAVDESDNASDIRKYLNYAACGLYKRCLEDASLRCHANRSVDLLAGLLGRDQSWRGLDIEGMFYLMSQSLKALEPTWRTDAQGFALVVSMTRLWTTLMERGRATSPARYSYIERQLLNYLWLHLESSKSKHHVDAVHLLWSIKRVSPADQHGVNLSMFLTERLIDSRAELADFERFMCLWGHTIQKQQARSDRKPSLNTRRASNVNLSMDVTLVEAEEILARPLMIVLDSLTAGASDVSAVIAAWLRTLPSLDRILFHLIKQLELALEAIQKRSIHVHNSVRRERSDQQYMQELDVSLHRLLGVLTHSSHYTWAVLSELRFEEAADDKAHSTGIQILADLVVKIMLAIDCAASESTQRLLLRILDSLLTSMYAGSLKSLQTETSLLQLLEKATRQAQGPLQVELLRVLPQALRVRESAEPSNFDKKRPKTAEHPSTSNDPLHIQTGGSHMPPPQLVDCIKEAMQTPSSRLYLEYWMKVLHDILPLYSATIVGSMIPLVECFCAQINQVFECIQKMATQQMAPEEQMPTSPLFELLHGLELVLANAHKALGTAPPEPVGLTVLSPSAQGFFGAPAAQPAPGDPSKTAKANSRLTVILCVHDAVELCFKMLTWASYGVDTNEIDGASASTAAHNSQRIRSRAKKMLEHMFTAEGLESVETMISAWAKAKQLDPASSQADEILSIINALAATRPRAAMPLILYALYSRTNIESLDVAHRSTLTCDLSANDIAAFLLKYVSTTEDDALEEIWSDYSALMRDVLVNPMPHRHVLPIYLELTVLLAEKVDNTNFGERQRIHRDLADYFSRLLTALFTTRLNTGPYESPRASSKSNDRSGDTISSLIAVTPKLQIVLETTDRILIAVNSITQHAVSPSFHARAFPDNVRPDLLQLTGLIATQNPDAKLWRREVGDAFSDARIFGAEPEMMRSSWFPLLRKWSAAEKTVIADTLSRIVAPSAAALMFGVGANSARLAADRTAQHSLRRVALLLLANDHDSLSSTVPIIDSKITELCTATLTSAPSCATRADIFMLWRALVLSTNHVHIAGMWPTINATLQAALLSVCPPGPEQETYNNLSLFQACKLLDMLVTVQPEDFQLQEWIFLTNTIDAVHASAVQTASLVDEVAEALASGGSSNGEEKEAAPDERKPNTPQILRTPLLARSNMDTGDIKAMPREDFTKQILLPFFTEVGVAAYEGTYQMGKVDLEACRRDLLNDLMDEGTVV